MISKVILLYSLISTLHLTHSVDQVPDLLIIGKDTLQLKSFPLEQLDFQVRPFQYGDFFSPGPTCVRGYQATWKVIDHKLFLWRMAKIDDPQVELDLPRYFEANHYSPILINGLIFADWYTVNLSSFPKDIRKCAYLFKTYRVNRDKPVIRFESGVLRTNRYR